MTAEAFSTGPVPLEFRPDVEGLRAVAVLIVVAFHAGVPGFSGGFVGVDVFFVLSGFLITRLLVNEHERTGTVALGRFYARRARRLLPASTLVVLATLIGTALVASPLIRDETARTARWVVAFAANLRFMNAEDGYFAEGITPSPLLHFWSLAVEEQFYLIWPGLILLIGLRAPRSTDLRRRLTFFLGALIPLSLVASVVVTGRDESAAFYLLPTRAWELGAGALLAIAPTRTIERGRAQLLSMVGVAGIAIATVMFDGETAFPGFAAALPVGATILLLLVGPHASGFMATALRLQPLQTIGAYSYSLYLWHWPVLVLAAVAAPRIGRSPLLSVGVVLAIAVPATVISHRFVENPVRYARALQSSGRSLALGGALLVVGMAVALAASALLRFDSGRPAVALGGTSASADYEPSDFVPSDMRPDLRSASADLPSMYDDPGCDWQWETTAATPCAYGDANGEVTITLLGDSHAGQWSDPLRSLALEHNWRLETLVTPSCSAMSYPIGRQQCAEWRENALNLLETDPPDVVIVVDSGTRIFGRDAEAWEAGVRSTLDRLSAVTTAVVFGESSRPPSLADECLADHLDDVRACEPDPEDEDRTRMIAVTQRIAGEVGVDFVDLTPLLCWDGRCPSIVADVLVYRDGSHVTRTFAQLRASDLAVLLEPLIDVD